MSRRNLTLEEVREFERAFAESRPLKPISKSKVLAARTHAHQGDVLGTGLDGRTTERLKRGVLEPEARLDLHGHTESVAHRVLLQFLRNAQLRGIKLVLVVTGKGGRIPAPDEPFDLELERRSRGVLKNAVPRWLREPAFAPLIAATRDAHRRHGGTGALYIYLRKPPR